MAGATITLTDELAGRVAERAREAGLSTEEFVRPALESELGSPSALVPRDTLFELEAADASAPADLAARHDRYLYGASNGEPH